MTPEELSKRIQDIIIIANKEHLTMEEFRKLTDKIHEAYEIDKQKAVENAIHNQEYLKDKLRSRNG